MAVIKQISVFDGTNWGTDDIGANAANIDFATSAGTTANIAGSSNLYTGLSNILPASKLTASRALVTGSDQKLAASNVTATQLGYLSGVTSSIQTQINTLNTNLGNKITKNSFTATTGKPTANLTPAFGATATISQVTQATSGQISVTDRTIKIPNTAASTSAAGLMSAGDKTKLNKITIGSAYFYCQYGGWTTSFTFNLISTGLIILNGGSSAIYSMWLPSNTLQTTLITGGDNYNFTYSSSAHTVTIKRKDNTNFTAVSFTV